MTSEHVAIVAIGRNEGERLGACLRSAAREAASIVYVDSGSVDSSVALARSMGCEVVELDLAQPFTAARARNAGARRAFMTDPELRFIQFVDGDCEIVEGWTRLAVEKLSRSPDVAVVFGSRREQYPAASRYNRVCDIEWAGPIGEAQSCGGDAMIRASAFFEVGGYDASLIAGEEPELCLRLRRRGFRILRINGDMTLHDAAITSFRQWWRRMVRAGHAYAEGYARHGGPPEYHYRRENLSILSWGLLFPGAVLALAVPTLGISLVLLLGYFYLYYKILRRTEMQGYSKVDARLYARLTVLGKFPQALGLLRYWWGRLSGRGTAIIEYKRIHSAAAGRSDDPS